MAQILCGLSYKVSSTFITKFGTIELFILILDISAVIHQSPCCYVVTTSIIDLKKTQQKIYEQRSTQMDCKVMADVGCCKKSGQLMTHQVLQLG